jgi:hypothetical protein
MILDEVAHQLCLAELEVHLKKLEKQAIIDIKFMYKVHLARHQDMRRLQSTMEFLARNRFTIFLILSEADNYGTRARVSHASDRYEALERLYEGAISRIASHRAWKLSHRLDILIIAIIMLDMFWLLLGL